MNPIEGQIHIDTYPGSTREMVVEITSSRPLQAQQILIGKTPAQALSIIPLLYNICGTAQSRAALSSIQHCLKSGVDPQMEIARDMLLLVEVCKEHLMRIFLDWPKLFDVDTGNQNLSFLNQLTVDFKPALFTQGNAFSLESSLNIDHSKLAQLIENLQMYLHDHVFSTLPSDWLAKTSVASILQWSEQTTTVASRAVNSIYQKGWAAQGNTDCQQLPELDSRQLLDRFDQGDVDEFIARPQWQGRCYETTALSRQLDHPLVQSFEQEFKCALITRWLARLVELARIPQQLTELLESTGSCSLGRPIEKQYKGGLAQIESARGRLIHRVEIEQGLISHYQILAPTEWNFHPQGLICQSLANLQTSNKTEFNQLAHLVINAIDPCVGYVLRTH